MHLLAVKCVKSILLLTIIFAFKVNPTSSQMANPEVETNYGTVMGTTNTLEDGTFKDSTV